MNLDNLNKWLTLVANVGVIAGIFFLAVEIRQNSNMMESQTRDSVASKQVDIYLAISTNPDANDIYTRGRAGLLRERSLNDPEYNAWAFLAFANLYVWENEWYQYDKGLFGREEYEARSSIVSTQLNRPGYAEVWERNSVIFSKGFREHVASLDIPALSKNSEE